MWANLFNASACQFERLEPLFFEIWEKGKDVVYWHWPNVWKKECIGVWSGPEFPSFVEEAGLVEYWREVGWPTMCQPVGDSFACGRNIGEQP